MARIKVYRSLPPLSEAMAHFKGFPDDRSRQQTLIEELGTLARKLRKEKPVPFYSMREIAAFFKVPLGTLSLVYQVLEKEGLLNRLRSSQTMLPGKARHSRDVIRGVVGVPIWLHSMLRLPYTPIFAMEIEEKLRRSGYVADIIFHYEKEEESDPAFAIRLLRHRLDALVLHSPLAGSMQNILSLRERGVRIFIIQRSEVPRHLPALYYLTDYRTPYEEMARVWQKAGIRKVWLWSPLNHLNYSSEADIFLSILKTQGISVHPTQDSPRALLKKIRQEKKISAAVAFLDTTNSETLCNREPHVIELISRAARLAFCVGTINVPYLQLRGVLVDIVAHSPIEIAGRIAADISRMGVLRDGVCRPIEATYRELQPFGDARLHWNSAKKEDLR